MWRLKAKVTRRCSLVLDKQKRFQLSSELAETVRWPQWSKQLVPKPWSSDIKRPVAQTSSGPQYMAPDDRRRRLASGADLHVSERYNAAQPCSDLNISVASLKSTRRRTEARCIKLRSRKSAPPHPRAWIHSHATLRPRDCPHGSTAVGAARAVHLWLIEFRVNL